MKMNIVLTALVFGAGIVLSAQDDPYASLGRFKFGDSRLPLAQIEEQIRKTAPSDYPQIEKRLLAVLDAPDTQKDAKRYICRWLAVVGSEACVPHVTPLLTDADLSHPARMALEPMQNAAAGAALRDALSKVQGKLLAGVIGSIGVRRDPLAVPALAKLTGNPDPVVAEAALFALGQIGTLEAARALDTASVSANLSRAHARARVLVASRLAEQGQTVQAAQIYRSLMSPAQPPSVRVAALKGLIGALPQPEAVKLVSDTLQADDEAMRAATLAAYAGSTNLALKNAVAAELPNWKTASQLLLLGVLTDQPEINARPALLKILDQNPESKVKSAVLNCLGVHGQADDVARIVRMGTEQDAAVAAAAKNALQRLGKPGVDDALVKLVESPNANERAVVLGVLANRRVESALPALARLLKAADAALALEAAKALGVMGKTEQLSDLAGVVGSVSDAGLRNAAGDAIKAICRRAPDKSVASKILLSALANAATPTGRAALLQLLPYAGGDDALAAAVKASQDPEATVRQAATRALVSWPDVSAAKPLFELAKTADAGQSAMILRDGCLRLAESEEAPASQRLEIYRGVLEVAKRPEEKKRALAGLGDLPSLGALELLQSYARDAALKNEAALALVRLARQLAAAYPKQAKDALEQIKTLTADNEAIQNQVVSALKAIQNAGQAPDGYIIAWRMSGPYQQEGKDGSALFDIAFPPEKPNGSAVWRLYTVPAGKKNGLVEFDKIFPGDNRVAYLKTTITSERAQEARLEMGSDDGIKVWLNGKVVHANNATRPCTPGSDKARIQLKEGANELLVKVTQGGGEWSVSVRLRAADGKEISGVTIAPGAD